MFKKLTLVLSLFMICNAADAAKKYCGTEAACDANGCYMINGNVPLVVEKRGRIYSLSKLLRSSVTTAVIKIGGMPYRYMKASCTYSSGLIFTNDYNHPTTADFSEGNWIEAGPGTSSYTCKDKNHLCPFHLLYQKS